MYRNRFANVKMNKRKQSTFGSHILLTGYPLNKVTFYAYPANKMTFHKHKRYFNFEYTEKC